MDRLFFVLCLTTPETELTEKINGYTSHLKQLEIVNYFKSNGTNAYCLALVRYAENNKFESRVHRDIEYFF